MVGNYSYGILGPCRETNSQTLDLPCSGPLRGRVGLDLPLGGPPQGRVRLDLPRSGPPQGRMGLDLPRSRPVRGRLVLDLPRRGFPTSSNCSLLKLPDINHYRVPEKVEPRIRRMETMRALQLE